MKEKPFILRAKNPKTKQNTTIGINKDSGFMCGTKLIDNRIGLFLFPLTKKQIAQVKKEFNKHAKIRKTR